MRRRLPDRRSHVHRRRLQLCRADRRRRRRRGAEPPPKRRAARHLRCDRAGRERGARGAGGRRRRRASTRSSRRPCRCRATSSRRRRASTRPASSFIAWLNGHQSHFTMVGGQQSARSLPHFAELFRLADARGPARAARARRARMQTPARAARHRRLNSMRDFSADHRWLSINTATLRGAGTLARILDAARATASARSRPGATRSQRSASSAPPRGREHGLELSGYCRGGMFPASTPPAGGPRSTTTGARSTRPHARRGLPGARRRRPARRARRQRRITRTFRGARATSATASPRCSSTRGSAACRSRSSRCIRCTPPTAPASTRSSRRSMSATRSIPRPTARASSRLGTAPSASRVDLYHVWWDPKLEAQIERAGRERLLAFHVCDWLMPTRDLLNDRGMMGDGVIDIPRIRALGRGAGLRRLQRGRDLLERGLVAAARGRGARHLHRAPPQRRLG